MTLKQVEKNLLILLDPAGDADEGATSFRKGAPIVNGRSALSSAHTPSVRIVASFGRSEIVSFFLFTFTAWLTKGDRRIRKILYLNDGLLSSIFDLHNSAGYKAFAHRHLPRKTGLRGRLRRLLPPLWKADLRFVVVEYRDAVKSFEPSSLLGNPDFMFYSNPAGKLMLTRIAAFHSGSGILHKTTASPAYARCLEWEHRIVTQVAELLKRPGHLPATRERVTLNGRPFFSEDYLCGESLREVLRRTGERQQHDSAATILKRLDRWFIDYLAAFSATRVSLFLLYKPLLAIFSESCRDTPTALSSVGEAEEFLRFLDQNHPGLVPVIAHNDLWPGNFIVNGDHITAVDWERATEQSPPLFDYYWMIISAVLEYLVGSTGLQDYSLTFRLFLEGNDPVCRQGRHQLDRFLELLGLDSGLASSFMILFLMEWSVQGYRSLGRTTDMDRLAQGELVHFIGRNGYRSPLGTHKHKE